MWIIPKNFSGTYPSVQGTQELGLESNEFCQLCEKSLMWKSKATQSKTWLTRWNKDTYLQHLSTQTLKPFHSQTFVDAWTSYLAAFPASPLAKPGREEAPKTHGISSPTLPMESTPVQQDMFSSKTSKESSPPKPLTGRVFSDMSSENWNSYIIQRRSEYSVRQKQAQATKESEYLSLLQEMESPSMTCSPDTQSQNPPLGQQDPTNNSLNGKSQESWATPNTMDHLPSRSVESQMQRALGVRKGRSKPDNLREQVDPEQVAVYQEAKNWPTPTAAEGSKIGGQANYGQVGLSNHPSIVGLVTREKGIKSGKEKNWPTPNVSDIKGANVPHDIGRNYLRSEVLDDYKKSSGKLNPSWVEQLMGLPVQWSMLPEPTSAHRVSRLMLLGNGVVPQQAELAFRTLLAQADLNRQS
tara:strand:+ start:33 stop:1268 length:1236 start_codon:yes stop_codon:yes gene_type:complete